MQFSDTSTSQGIVQMIDKLCSSDSNSYLIADKVRSINNYYDEIYTLMVLRSGSRQVDDVTASGVAEETTAFSSGTRKIDLPSGAMFIEHVEVQDQNGKYNPIKRTDKSSVNYSWAQAIEGTPTEFDEKGDYIEFNYLPNYSGNVKIWYTRQPDLFTASDTTAVPGIQRVLHQYMAYGASIEYCIKFKPERVSLYEKRLEELRRMAKKLTGKAKMQIKPFTSRKSTFK